MPRFRIQDIHSLENSPTSAGSMRSKFGELILNSTVCRAKIEGINAETGEYRVILQGTLDKEDSKWEES